MSENYSENYNDTTNKEIKTPGVILSAILLAWQIWASVSAGLAAGNSVVQPN